MNVVAVGAHPDDIEIGVGGTVALHEEQGDSVTFLVLTNGSAVEGATAEIRQQEATEAADVLGVDDVRFLGFEDTRIPDNQRVVKEIESHIESIDPGITYIHSEQDTHQDHRKAALTSIAATRKYDKVFSFESPSTRSSYTPNHFVPFTETILNKKIKSIRTHESQAEKKYMEAEAMQGLARFRGRQSNSIYAESFEVVRNVDRLISDTADRV